MDINFTENGDGTITWSPTLTKETEIPAGTRMTADAFNRLMIGAVKQSNHTAKSLAEFVNTYNAHRPDARKLEQLATNKIEVEELDANADPTAAILEGSNGYYFKFSNLKGAKGDKGDPGPQGNPGKNGTNGTNGKDGKDGENGKDGEAGTQLSISADGYWVIDGTVTKYPTRGPQGPQGVQGPKGPQGLQGVGIPSGGTAGQILTKTESGTAWQDAPSGGGNSIALLYIPSMSGYGSYELFFALPKDFSNVKEIKIKYTLQYDSYNYNVVTNNSDVIIYTEQQGFFTPTLRGLLSDAYSSTETYDVSTRWDTEGISANIFTLDFYNATGGNGGGNTVYILFEIQYK